jgi:hypothetical protein
MARAKRVKNEAKQEQATERQEALTPTPEAAPEKQRNKGGRPRKVKPEATPGSETPEPPITLEEAEPSPLVTVAPEAAAPMEPDGANEESSRSIAEPGVGDTPAPPAMKATSRPLDGGVPMKPNPLYIETKSKRIQLMLQPSVYDGARKLAEADGLSFNEFVHRKLEKAIGISK